MKRTLGKKNCVQDGTLVAFASCSCDSMCSILGCDCSTGDTASNTLRLHELFPIVVNGNLRHMGILMARSTQHMRVGSTMYCPPNIIKKVGLR